MDPPPTRTPPCPIRPDGEIPDSEDDDEQRSSDFEDLPEDTQTVNQPAPTTSASGPSAPTAIPQPTTQSCSQPKLPLPSTGAPKHLVISSPVPQPVSTCQHQLSTAEATSASPDPTITHLAPSPPTNPKTIRLQSQISDLQSKVLDMQSQITLMNSKLEHPEEADAIVKAHIKLLHDYNEIKDVGLGLMGLIAEGRGVRLGEVMAELGVGGQD